MDDLTDAEEWRRLYECVRAACLQYGTEDAFGHGDFWVVDDCWGGVGQKVVVTNPLFITRRLVAELSACIVRLGLLGAEIVVALETGDGKTEDEAAGLVVHSAGFVEYWDLQALRAKYGNTFFA